MSSRKGQAETMRLTRRLLSGAALLGATILSAEQFPKTVSENLNGQTVNMPDEMKGHVSVVIIGFSKNSQNAVKKWDSEASQQLGEAAAVYQVAVLEDAPSFVRGMIKRAMRGGTPADRQSHFLVVVTGEAELKKAAGFQAADEPYVLVLDSGGEIRWKTHGAESGGALKELAGQVRGLK